MTYRELSFQIVFSLIKLARKALMLVPSSASMPFPFVAHLPTRWSSIWDSATAFSAPLSEGSPGSRGWSTNQRSGFLLYVV